MKTRPFYIKLASAALFMIAISLPIQIGWLYHHSFFQIDAIFEKLTILNYIVIFLCLSSSWLIFQGDKLAQLVLPITLMFIVINNWLVADWGYDFSLLETSFASLAFALFTAGLYLPAPTAYFSTQHLQHWRGARRIRGRVPVCLKLNSKKEVLACTFDISKSGAFIALDSASESYEEWTQLLKVGLEITVQMNLETPYQVSCHGKIVRKSSEETGHYPMGVGVQFKKMNRGFKRYLAARLDPVASGPRP